jgi:hypothetical protein
LSDPKPKSTIREILESGPTDPLLMAKLDLLEELQAAHAKGDHKTMLEIGRKLAANDAAFNQAREDRRRTMEKVVTDAKAVDDPDKRVERLLAAFQFCVKEACAANEESQDIETYNVGVRQLRVIGNELRAIPPNRFDALAQFLDSPDIELRGFAAVWLRKVMPERILPILKEINKTESFGTPVGTQVYIAIREFEQAKERNGESEPDAKP